MKKVVRKKYVGILRKLILLIDSFLSNLLLIFSALVFLFGLYALWDSNQVYLTASSSQYEAYKPHSSTSDDILNSFGGFGQLQKLNADVIGWLNIYGTRIDYPIVQGKDNDKYINTDSKGNYSPTGALFLDYRNSSNFDDFNSIIYGHHVENGVMFGDLSKFTNQKFFKNHHYGSIYYNGKEKGLEIIAVLEVDAYNFDIYHPGVSGDAERLSYYQNLLSGAIYKRDITITPNDQIILLSTCYLDVTNGRHIVIAKMTSDVQPNTFKKINKDPFPYSVFDDSTLGKFFKRIPLLAWYIIILCLAILLIILLIILYRMLKWRREEHSNR